MTSKMLTMTPAHQVAMTPRLSASRVGGCIANTDKWNSVKYSMQMCGVN